MFGFKKEDDGTRGMNKRTEFKLRFTDVLEAMTIGIERSDVMKKFQVIGGQYESCWYGESDTVHGAKIIAAKHREHWDNHQGWHNPVIYRAEDVMEIESKGRITTPDGWTIRVHKPYAIPYLTWNRYTRRWETCF